MTMKDLFLLVLFIVFLYVIFNPQAAGEWTTKFNRGFHVSSETPPAK